MYLDRKLKEFYFLNLRKIEENKKKKKKKKKAQCRTLMDRASLTLPSNPSFDLTFDSAGLQCRASDAQSKVVRLMSVPEHGEPS